jgi:uncharacterized repeat protein (TIGR01451 family)/uncharacterized delta-60 repeat protein
MKKHIAIASLGSIICVLAVWAAGPQPGSLDTSFDPGTGPNNFNAGTFAVQDDGKIVIGGSFTNYNGVLCGGIIRVHVDGSVDNSFDAGAGALLAPTIGGVRALAIQTDGKIVVGGQFATMNNVPRFGLARLETNGVVDAGFNPGAGLEDMGGVSTITVRTNGTIWIASAGSRKVYRLNADGTFDNTFNNTNNINGGVFDLVEQSDGKVVIAGGFDSVNGTTRNKIARLNADGSLDVSFNPGTGPNSGLFGTPGILSLGVQPDGKVIASGTFTTFNGVTRGGLVRLNTNGTVDTSFNVGKGTTQTIPFVGDLYGTVYGMALQDDGKVLIGGAFSVYKDVPCGYIARINADGSLDTDFDTSVGADNGLFALGLQPDGKVLIGGPFTAYDGVARPGVARLHGTSGGSGTVECSLSPSVGTNNINTAHVVTATILSNSAPVSGVTVNFEVTGGPNVGQIGVDTTDAQGHATFQYSGGATTGTDTISATGSGFSCDATVEWIDSSLLTADLFVSKKANKTKVVQNKKLVYTIAVTNSGPDVATGIVVTDTLPLNVAVVAGSTTPGYTLAGRTLEFDLGALGAGEGTNLVVAIKPKATGKIVNKVIVTANEPDPNTTNNLAKAKATVVP